MLVVGVGGGLCLGEREKKLLCNNRAATKAQRTTEEKNSYEICYGQWALLRRAP